MTPGGGPVAVLFDMGGTLEDVTREPAALARGEALLASRLSEAGVTRVALPPGELTTLIEEGLAAYKRRMNQERELAELPPLDLWSGWLLNHSQFALERLTAGLAEELSFLYETRCLSRRLRPEALPLLEDLSQRGYHLGVISNSISQTQVARTLSLHQLTSFFQTVQVSALAGRRKPHPLMFQRAAAELGVDPERCLYIGDTYTRDVLGARAAGYGYVLLMLSALGESADARDGDLAAVSGGPAAIWERRIAGLGEVGQTLAELRDSGKEGVRCGYAAS